MLRHLPSSKALRAAFTASSTSALSPSATSARTSSLAGLMVSKALPDLAGTHLPPINSLVGECFRNSNTALTFTPCVAFSIDGTAAAIFLNLLYIEVGGIVASGGGCAVNRNSRLRVSKLEL